MMPVVILALRARDYLDDLGDRAERLVLTGAQCRAVLHRGGNARQASQDACHRAFHRSVSGTAAYRLAQFRQAGCPDTGARLGESQVRNGQRARQHGIARLDGPDRGGAQDRAGL
jgi:hypothetical protein